MSDNHFIKYCLRGLERMYVPGERVFCSSYVLNDDRMVQRRNRSLEYRLTLNVLMGLYHARENGYEVFLDIESDYHHLLTRVDEHSNSITDIAATIWTGRCLGTDIPPNVMAYFENILHNAPQKKIHPSAKGLAWTIIACLTNGDEYHNHSISLAKLAKRSYVNPENNLVKQTPVGLRRNWSSFGAHSYMAYAFFLLARKTGSEWTRKIGIDIARKLVKLQGAQGQWGWMYNMQRGIVVDYYPIYSVHQYAYAPFFLTEALDLGYDEFKEPLMKGFSWVLGKNEMSESMVSGTHGVIWRNMIRTPPNSQLVKIVRGACVAWMGLKSGLVGADSLMINRECWSFEMALPLCVFSGRNDFDDMLNDTAFRPLT